MELQEPRQPLIFFPTCCSSSCDADSSERDIDQRRQHTLNASAVTQGVGNSITNITIFDGNTSLGSTLPIIISNPSGTHTYKAVASDQYGPQDRPLPPSSSWQSHQLSASRRLLMAGWGQTRQSRSMRPTFQFRASNFWLTGLLSRLRPPATMGSTASPGPLPPQRITPCPAVRRPQII